MLRFIAAYPERLRALLGWRRYGLAYLLGALAALAFPPFNAIPLLWIGFPSLVFLLQAAQDKRRAFAIGWCFAFGFLTVSMYWIAGALFVDIGQFWWLVPFAACGLPAMFAVYHGLAALIAWRLGIKSVGGVLALGVGWALADYARGHLMTGFPWDLTGYVWGDVLPMLQITSVIGIYGLTLLTSVLAVAPAVLVKPVFIRASVPIFGSLVLLFIVLASWGQERLAAAPVEDAQDVRVRLVQPAIHQRDKWKETERDSHFDRLLDLSFDVADPSIKAVIWPETATSYYLTEETEIRRAIADRMSEGQTVLTGVVQRGIAPDKSLMYYNSLIAMDRSGRVSAGYAKHHLVPFGEYVPFRRFLPFRAVAAVGDFTPGEGLLTIRTDGLPPFSALVCYEAIFPGEVARLDDRPAWLLNVTNDAWYEGTTGPAQHFAIVRVRAIEEGLPLVRVANMGVNAVVDSYGRIKARAGYDNQSFTDSILPKPLSEPPPYARWKDMPFWVMAGLLALASLALRKRS